MASAGCLEGLLSAAGSKQVRLFGDRGGGDLFYLFFKDFLVFLSQL